MSRQHAHHRAAPTKIAWGRTLLGLLACAVVAWLATGVYMVRTNEVAVVRRCGKALPDLRKPGLHVGYPYPIDRVNRLKPHEYKRVGVGVTLAERAVGRQAEAREAECLTGDRNLILVSAYVQYRIADEKAFLFRVAGVPALVRDHAASALTSVIARMTVDDFLTAQRETVESQVRERTQEGLDRCGAGVAVHAVLLEGRALPAEVADAFADVNAARVDRQRAIDEARGYADRLLPEAQGEAERTRLEAEAYAEEVVKKAQGDADRFEQIAAQLGGSRDLAARRLILEAMEEILPRLNKVVLDGAARQALDLGLFEEK